MMRALIVCSCWLLIARAAIGAITPFATFTADSLVGTGPQQSKVSFWTNLEGGLVLSSANGPMLYTNMTSVNYHAYVRFNGVDGYLTNGTVQHASSKASEWVFVLRQEQAFLNDGSTRVILDGRSSSHRAVLAVTASGGNASSNAWLISRGARVAGGFPRLNTWMILRLQFLPNGKMSFWTNNVLAGAGHARTAELDGFTLGTSFSHDNATFNRFSLAELRIYTNEVNADWGSIYQELSSKYYCPTPITKKTVSPKTLEDFDVADAVSVAYDGDTVLLPAGSARWTNKVSVSAGIVLRGQGMTNTVIIDEATNVNDVLIQLNTAAGKSYRVTQLGFERGVTSVRNFNQGAIWVNGRSRMVRIDHCRFNRLRDKGVAWFGGDACGVMDHCIFHIDNAHAFDVYHMGWPPEGDSNQGDGSWSTPTEPGTTNCVVAEDCLFNRVGGGLTAFCDGFAGARYVVRYSVITNSFMEGHGTDTSGRWRGTRWMELYGCSLYYPSNAAWPSAMDLRSGSGVCFSNTLFGVRYPVTLNSYRMAFAPAPWGGAHKYSPWDCSSNEVYAAGLHTGPVARFAMTDTNQIWKPNQWVGFVCYNTNSRRSSLIMGNSVNHVVLADESSNGGSCNFTNGQGYEIHFVRHLLDDCGMGAGTLITNRIPAPRGWPGQTNEPVYAWSNTMLSGNSEISPTFFGRSTIRPGSEYFNNTARPGYTPLVYPHPLVLAQDGAGGIDGR